MSGDSPTPVVPSSPSTTIWSDAALAALVAHVARERSEPLSVLDKPVPVEWVGRTPASFADAAHSESRWADLATPAMTLSRAALDHNRTHFAAWVAEHGVAHAPHGKTSMAPALWLEQLRAGAWGITVATEVQARVAVEVGVPRVLVANLLIRPGGVRWVAQVRRDRPQSEVISWLDSVEAVTIVDDALDDSALPEGDRLPVLVELGTVRTGARTADDAVRVAEAVAHSRHLELIGVGGYEGVAVKGHEAADAEVIRGFLRTMADVAERVRPWVSREQVVLSAGGSTWFDLVAEVFGPSRADTLVLVRSGAMVSHDDGTYAHSTPAAREAEGPTLRAALHVWARVLSLPEPGRAVLDAGKRDLPVDSGLPVPQVAMTADGPVRLEGHTLVGTNDQHATMAVPTDSPLGVGDVVRMGISHPCTAFDKWRVLPVIDDADAADPRVVDWVRTWF